MKSIQQLAADALAHQSACNLSALAHTFHKATNTLWKHARECNKGTDFVNTHPVSVLYTAQMSFLSSGSICSTQEYNDAYKACQEWAKGKQ